MIAFSSVRCLESEALYMVRKLGKSPVRFSEFLN